MQKPNPAVRPFPEAETPDSMAAVRARQGVTGHKVRYVLIISTLGAALSLTVLLVVFRLFH